MVCNLGLEFRLAGRLEVRTEINSPLAQTVIEAVDRLRMGWDFPLTSWFVCLWSSVWSNLLMNRIIGFSAYSSVSNPSPQLENSKNLNNWASPSAAPPTNLGSHGCFVSVGLTLHAE